MIWPRLDRRSVLIGTAVTLVFIVPAGIAAAIADDASNLSLLLSAVIMAGFLLGGIAAARRQPQLPLAHGAIAALVAFLAFQAVGVVLRLARGDEVHPVRIVAVALLSACVGMIGGFVANVLRLREERRESGTTGSRERPARLRGGTQTGTGSEMSILVVDVGTSAVRAAVVRDNATIEHEHRRELPPDTPAPGLVEFDPARMASAALEVAKATLADAGSVDGVGIANQRASTIVWDRATGEPVGPGIGWQDLRTVGECLVIREQGVRLAPNVTATKAAHLLDAADAERTRDLCVGTVDSWTPGPCPAARSTSPTSPTRPHRPPRRGRVGLGRAAPRGAPHRREGDAHPRGLLRRVRDGQRARRVTAPPGAHRRSAAALAGQGVWRPVWPRSRSEPAACSTSVWDLIDPRSPT